MLLLALVPISFNRFAAYPFDWHKAALLRSVVAIVFFFWLLQHWKKPIIVAKSRTVFIALFCFLLSNSLSTAFSVAPTLSLFGSLHRGGGLLTTLAFAALFFIAGQGLKSAASRDRLVTTLLIVSLPVALYAMMQHAGVDPLFWAENVSYRATSTIGNPIFLSAFLNYAFLMGLARLLYGLSFPGDTPTQRSSPLLLALLIIQLWAIWIAQSRGPILALAVGLMALVLATKPSAWLPIRRMLIGLSKASLMLILAMAVAWTLILAVNASWTAAMISLAVTASMILSVFKYRLAILLPSTLLLAALILIFSFAFQFQLEPLPAEYRVEEHVQNIMSPLQSTLARDGSAQERIHYWQGYRDAFLRTEPIKLIRSDPKISLFEDQRGAIRHWLGYGPETSGDILSENFPLELAAHYPINIKIDRAHNSVWDRLVNQGILGLLTWLAFMVILIDAAIKRLGRQITPYLRWSSWALAFISTASVTWLLGSEFFGLVLQLSVIAGALLQLLLSQRQQQTDWITAAALAAILMHLAETSVGIPITSSELLFWLCAALVVSSRGQPRPSNNFSAASAGGLLAVIVGGLAFSFLGVEGMPRFDAANLFMISTPNPSGLTGWLASITGTTWQTGSTAGLIALYAGIFGLGTISMASLIHSQIFADSQELNLMLKKFWPLAILSALLIGGWQWLLSTKPVLLTWHDSTALINAGAAQADALALRSLLFYFWVIASLFWLAHCLTPISNSTAKTFRTAQKATAVFYGAVTVYVLGVGPSMASAYVHTAKRWGGGDLEKWLSVAGKAQETLYRIALKSMERATAFAPRQPEYQITLAKMSSLAGLSNANNCNIHTSANQAIFEAIRLHPSDVIALRGLVVLATHHALTAPDPVKREAWLNCALSYYQLLYSFSPKHPQTLAEKSEFALKTLKRPELAATLSSEALLLHHKTFKAIQTKILLAQMRQQTSCSAKRSSCEQDRNELIDWLKRALRIKPKHLANRLLLINQYLLAEKHSEARSSLLEGIKKHPQNAAMLASLEKTAKLTKDAGLPLEVIETAIARQPANAALLLARIELLIREERRDEALAALQSMMQDPKLLRNKSATRAARSFIRLGNIASANEAYHLALQSVSGDAIIWLEAAYFSIAIDDRISAVSLLDKAALHANNRPQAIQIEQLRLDNFKALSAEKEILFTRQRLQTLNGNVL